MKANHNDNMDKVERLQVVVNISSSKNESKSQLVNSVFYDYYCCCKYQ
nr:hypothetical protein [Pedobacter puniceum]